MKKIFIVFDCSGSFFVRGKKNLLSYAFYTIQSIVQRPLFEDIEVDCMYWQDDKIRKLTNSDILDNPVGCNDCVCLAEFLQANCNQQCIVLTDACMDTNAWKLIENISDGIKANVRMVLVGADADWQMAGRCGICLFPLEDLPVVVQEAALQIKMIERI